MIIGLTSDLHLGASSAEAIADVLRQMAAEKPDVVIVPGDHNGGHTGYRAVGTVFKLIRQHFPDTPVLTTMGNHDYWVRGRRKGAGSYDGYTWNYFGFHHPSLKQFGDNLNRCIETFKKHNVHFLDLDGVYRHPDWPGHAIFGHTLWYNNPEPPTNDAKYLPHINDGIHRYMYNEAMHQLSKTLGQLTPDDTFRIFVSHFGVTGVDDSGSRAFGGNLRTGEIMRDEYDAKIFINGHAHQRHEGPIKYESGSDYTRPDYLIINA